MSYVLSALAFIILLPLLTFIRTWYRAKTGSRKHGCSDPPKRPALDLFFGLDNKWKDLKADGSSTALLAEAELHRQLGHTWRETTIFGSYFHTATEENIHAVLGSKSKDWGIQPFRHAGMELFCGDGVLSVDGASWEHSRNLFKPSFYKDNISDLSQFEHSFKLMLRQLPKDGSTIDFQTAILPMFVDTTTKFILGESLGLLDQKEPEETPVSGEAFLEHFKLSARAVGVSFLLGPFRRLLPKSFTTVHWDVVHRFLEYHIDRERAKHCGDNPSSATNRSLLHGISQQTDNRKLIRDQLAQGFLGGMDTMEVLLSNAVRFLSRAPEIWDRLRTEVKDVSRGSLTIEEVAKYPLVRNILRETLRLHPVFPVLARDTLTDTILPAGGGAILDQPIFIPSGSRITLNFWVLHRDASVFGPEVERFNPDRWEHIKPTTWQFLPFGGGPRRCLAQRKGFGEASCALIRLAQAYERVEARDESEYRGELRLVARNVNGCRVGLIPA